MRQKYKVLFPRHMQTQDGGSVSGHKQVAMMTYFEVVKFQREVNDLGELVEQSLL